MLSLLSAESSNYKISIKVQQKKVVIHDQKIFFLKFIFNFLPGSFYYRTKCPSIVIVDEFSECFETQHEHQHDPALAPTKPEKPTPITSLKIDNLKWKEIMCENTWKN